MQHDQQRRFILAGLQFLRKRVASVVFPVPISPMTSASPFMFSAAYLSRVSASACCWDLKKKRLSIVMENGFSLSWKNSSRLMGNRSRLEIGNATLLPLGQGDAGGSHRGGFSGRRVVFRSRAL